MRSRSSGRSSCAVSTSGAGLAFSQSVWTSRFGFGGYGTAGPIGRGEELGLQALIQAEGRARDRDAKAFGQSGALCVEDGALLNWFSMPSSGVTGWSGRADVVAEDGGQQSRRWGR